MTFPSLNSHRDTLTRTHNYSQEVGGINSYLSCFFLLCFCVGKESSYDRYTHKHLKKLCSVLS